MKRKFDINFVDEMVGEYLKFYDYPKTVDHCGMSNWIYNNIIDYVKTMNHEGFIEVIDEVKMYQHREMDGLNNDEYR